nr:MAG TPA: hypothetical protein [Caudoviricetes sp.]
MFYVFCKKDSLLIFLTKLLYNNFILLSRSFYKKFEFSF